MKELSIFIDESGDWGEYEKHSPFYIVTMVIHEQDKSIENELKHLNERLMASLRLIYSAHEKRFCPSRDDNIITAYPDWN